MKPVGLGAHADVLRIDAAMDDDLSEISIGDDSLGGHDGTCWRFLKTCWRFFENDFAFLSFHQDFSTFFVQVEGGGGVRLLVHNHQGMLVGKAVDIESGKRVGHRSIHQQAVVYIDAEVLSGEVGADFDAVAAFVGFLPVGVTFESVCHVEENARYHQYGDEEHGIEYHEVLMWVMSFSAHIVDKFLQKYKKNREIL